GGGEGGGGGHLFGVERLALPGDVHDFLQLGAGAQDDVLGEGLARFEVEIGDDEGGVGRKRDGEPVAVARGQVGEAVGSAGVGEGAALAEGQVVVAQHQRGPGKGLAVPVEDLAGEHGVGGGGEGDAHG